MIDPVTECLLEQQEQKEFETLMESIWDAPEWIGNAAFSLGKGARKVFDYNYKPLDVATVNMRKFNQHVKNVTNQAVKQAQTVSQNQSSSSGVFKGLAAAALATAIVAVAYQVYKRYMSKAAKACKDYSSQEKTSCMNRYRIDSLKRQIKELEIGYPLCDKTNDVYDCRYKIKNKIRKLKTKLGEL